MKNRKPAIIGLAVVGLFSAYHMVFGKAKPVTNVATIPYTESDKRSIEYEREEVKFLKDKADFIEILDYLVTLEDLAYFNMKWDIPDKYTMVVTLDIDNAARANNATAVQVYEVVRATKDNFGYYLQVFNNTFHKGQAKEGDLTLIIKNKAGQEIARTEKLIKTQ
ncbi:hypothetical protein CHOTACABRAS_230 [Bacillus phage Chotacabras]|nr:hypothetical protein CHOTACABRAS_230 [Bacillus phage Chotacabras]